MILTPIVGRDLPKTMDRFAWNLTQSSARRAFERIARTGAERAASARAAIHRLRAQAIAAALAIPVRPGAPVQSFGWDGQALRGWTEAYVLLHEIAHYQLASPVRRRRPEFGLGPGPETGCCAAAKRAAVLAGLAREAEEAQASLLGILWEVELGQPALASFLDQNWLEGAGRPSAGAYFERTLQDLVDARLVTVIGRPRFAIRAARGSRLVRRPRQALGALLF
jgi:hypothetical protein